MGHARDAAASRDAVRAIIFDLTLEILREGIEDALAGSGRCGIASEGLSRLSDRVTVWGERSTRISNGEVEPLASQGAPDRIDRLHDEVERLWLLAEALHREHLARTLERRG